MTASCLLIAFLEENSYVTSPGGSVTSETAVMSTDKANNSLHKVSYAILLVLSSRTKASTRLHMRSFWVGAVGFMLVPFCPLLAHAYSIQTLHLMLHFHVPEYIMMARYHLFYIVVMNIIILPACCSASNYRSPRARGLLAPGSRSMVQPLYEL